MQMGSAWPACTLLESQLLFWEVVTQDKFSSALKKPGEAAWSCRKSLSGGLFEGLCVPGAVGPPVPARARTKPAGHGAQRGLGTGTLDWGQLRAPWGADGEGDPQPGTGHRDSALGTL